jgi:hypothetical protein
MTKYEQPKAAPWKGCLYWTLTALIALLWTSGAIGSVMKAEASMAVYQHLGYPGYFARMLGTAQLLAVFALLAPVPVMLREWAYAGLTFDAAAAIASLLATGATIVQLTFPSLALAMVLASYIMWRRRANSSPGPLQVLFR